ncbi:hypothetical protein MACH16_13030 [Marinomonas pontica]|uniref:Uncharacterized protein n=1 Tax=Marinomonas pontica TaxID=264739 RepID=A0ABM8FE04_9GAMM|nr:hypothetical protein MACH16_13030 [Marinomonas pontica]
MTMQTCFPSRQTVNRLTLHMAATINTKDIKGTAKAPISWRPAAIAHCSFI